jgi:hypothetical protein
VIACRHFERTRWIAILLSEVSKEQRAQSAQSQQSTEQPAA